MTARAGGAGDLQSCPAGQLDGEAVLLCERKYGPYAAQHWSGGDDIVAGEIESGEASYWTVIFARTRATACAGKRWRSRAHAERWLTAERAAEVLS